MPHGYIRKKEGLCDQPVWLRGVKHGVINYGEVSQFYSVTLYFFVIVVVVAVVELVEAVAKNLAERSEVGVEEV